MENSEVSENIMNLEDSDNVFEGFVIRHSQEKQNENKENFLRRISGNESYVAGIEKGLEILTNNFPCELKMHFEKLYEIYISGKQDVIGEIIRRQENPIWSCLWTTYRELRALLQKSKNAYQSSLFLVEGMKSNTVNNYNKINNRFLSTRNCQISIISEDKENNKLESRCKRKIEENKKKERDADFELYKSKSSHMNLVPRSAHKILTSSQNDVDYEAIRNSKYPKVKILRTLNIDINDMKSNRMRTQSNSGTVFKRKRMQRKNINYCANVNKNRYFMRSKNSSDSVEFENDCNFKPISCNMDANKYKCSFCNYSTSFQSYLKFHERKHLYVKKKCSECNFFVSMYYKKCQENNLHVKEDSFLCPSCEKKLNYFEGFAGSS